MKLGILFSGGKDSTYATFLTKKKGYEIKCLITIISENKDSFMFHTPSIIRVKKQSEVMKIPLVVVNTKGEKEKELLDLENAIIIAIKKYKINGIVTGAVESIYQSSRIQKICNKLNIECFNPLWQKNQFELLNDLIENKFNAIVIGVFAEGFNKKWLGRRINKNFVNDIKKVSEKFGISVSGEGGEFESFVLNCPLFRKKLKIVGFKDFGGESSWRREIKVV